MINVGIITYREITRRSWIQRYSNILTRFEFNVSVYRISHNIPSFSGIIEILNILRWCKDKNIIYGWFAYPMTLIISKILMKPYILNIVGWKVALYGLAKNPLYRPLISYTLKEAYSLIAISNAAKN